MKPFHGTLNPGIVMDRARNYERGDCEARFRVTRPVISRELGNLVELGVAVRVGAGRSIRYRLKPEKLFVSEEIASLVLSDQFFSSAEIAGEGISTFHRRSPTR